VGGAVVNGLESLCSTASHLVVSRLLSRSNADPDHAEFLPTNNLAFPADRFRLIGGMDGTWAVAGGEDRDLCRRWRRQGYRIRASVRSPVRHCHRLTLAGFWRQHFGYGRGACLFRRPSASAPGVRVGFESPWFYALLLLAPLRAGSPGRALPLLALVALSQLATLCGYLREALRPPSARSGQPARGLPGRPRA
jgi:hypothetical protein